MNRFISSLTRPKLYFIYCFLASIPPQHLAAVQNLTAHLWQLHPSPVAPTASLPSAEHSLMSGLHRGPIINPAPSSSLYALTLSPDLDSNPGSQPLALSFYLLPDPAAVAFPAVQLSMRSLAAVDQWAAGANACLSPPLTSYPYTYTHTHTRTQMHAHTPQGGNRWGSARGKGCGGLQRAGLGECFCVRPGLYLSVFMCLFAK